jgi:hypothetical protein
MKSALFAPANVAVNTKLTSKAPILFGNFDVFKNDLVKNVAISVWYDGKIPPSVANISGGNFLGDIEKVQYLKVPLETGAPPIF